MCSMHYHLAPGLVEEAQGQVGQDAGYADDAHKEDDISPNVGLDVQVVCHVSSCIEWRGLVSS